MDINFKCPHCEQELTADESGAGSEIQCPSCNQQFVIPATRPAVPAAHDMAHPTNVMSSSAAAREEKHFAVPQHEKGPATPAPAIEKALKPLDAAAKETDKQLRVKTLRRSDCVEVGKDHFDEKATEILGKIGEANVVSISTFTYTHQDLATRQFVTDFGILIVFRG